MGYRNFRIGVVIRILLLLGLGYATLYVATRTYFWLVAFWLGLLVVALTIELIRYVERSERSLTHFLWAISQNDFTHTFAANPDAGGRRDRLREAYGRILEIFQRLRDEKETGYQYLQTVVEHVNVALICYNERGDIALMNAAAKKLLRKPFLKNIDSLEKIDSNLREAVQSLPSGQQVLARVEIDHTLMHLSIRSAEFKLHEVRYTLLSLQDIRYELEAQEVESWQKLIRVLTHEIMNSVIPISTLTSVVSDMLVDKQGQFVNLTSLDSETASDLQGSLETIESRSKGLVNFVKSYKSITQLPEPHFANVSLTGLLGRVNTLVQPAAREKGLSLNVIGPQPDLLIKADAVLLEQVLLNLVLNAMDAVAGQSHPCVKLSAGRDGHNQVFIQVKDNGVGIEPDVLPHIFVPFFTTKPQGTGVGLSLAKQIMLQHKGKITVQSSLSEGSTFSLVF